MPGNHPIAKLSTCQGIAQTGKIRVRCSRTPLATRVSESLFGAVTLLLWRYGGESFPEKLRSRKANNPMATEPEPKANESQKIDASAFARPMVFVVDPDPAFRKLMKFFLEEAGYAVTFFDDGYSALDRIRVNKPELLITEMILPHLDGLALCRLLRADPVTSDVKILVYTVLDSAARADASGANAFMKKPIEKKRLIDLVSSLRPYESAQEDA